MTLSRTEKFDRWIRGPFRDINTELEEIYFVQADRSDAETAGGDLKKQLVTEGNRHIRTLLNEGNTDTGFDNAYSLLGGVGLFMAACRRHEITEPSRETTSPLLEASALATHIASTLGVSPRFATAHLTTNNRAVSGLARTFTTLADEAIFLDYNSLGVFSYMRAADALRRIIPLGVSHPLALHLFEQARDALGEVAKWNEKLFVELDVDRFFFCVRPYYKPYRVGPEIYRGANAGDFAGINIIDMLLGVCSAKSLSYSRILVDKFLFMQPDEQEMLKDCMRRKSLMDGFLEARKEHSNNAWYKNNLGMFLQVLDAHGHAANQHHDYLVNRFIEGPSSTLPAERLKNITASGPPLPVLIAALEKLRDLRTAAKRDDIPSRYRDVELLRASLQ